MAESFPEEDASDYLLKAKHVIDRLLPVFLGLTVLYPLEVQKEYCITTSL